MAGGLLIRPANVSSHHPGGGRGPGGESKPALDTGLRQKTEPQSVHRFFEGPRLIHDRGADMQNLALRFVEHRAIDVKIGRAIT